MTLLCLSDFNQGDITAKAGDILTIAPGAATWLLESWPACWAVAPDAPAPVEEVVTEAIEAPHVDKMVHAPHKAKARAEANIDRRARARSALRG